MIIQDLKHHGRIYAVATFVVAVAITTLFLGADYVGISTKILTRDPYRAANVPPYFGYASLMGSAIWLVSGASTLATALFAKRALGAKLSDDSTYRILVVAGITGMMMATDDILLFHDALADSLRIPELIFHGVYAVCFLVLFASARLQLLRTPVLLLLTSLACFAASSLIDEFRVGAKNYSFMEDVFKLIAVLAWSIYTTGVCWDYMGTVKRLDSPPA